ncbi:MAG: glucose-1-phosphate thymidylyltransferase [Candidatus Dojkabacteria bacterium]|nr:MAG: glucose-1-phosphate thymidylyltransferase [Candidatus Dojkabacteria bacterium]
MKGIILAGGKGTRLYPITLAISKQLMPIYDKPMIYYPLSTLMMAGIRKILIITTPQHQSLFKQLLGDGSQLGCEFHYEIQEVADGLASALVIGENFIDGDNSALILGDNIFYGAEFDDSLEENMNPQGAIVYAYQVSNPERYGIFEFDNNMNVIGIEEKPAKPKSNYAQTGLYFYDNRAVEFAKQLRPSQRGEYEITDLHKLYINDGSLQVRLLGTGNAWLDTGTFESMNQASQFVEVIEKRQGVKIGCIEEIAYRKGYIDSNQLEKLAQPLLKSGYGEYLLNILENN